MGRAPCCDKANVKRGPWSPEEDSKLKEYIEKNGTGGNWIALPQKAGLKRCGKSCRLRWLNYLRPNIKHGEFSDEEDRIICTLYANIGSRWSIIAAQLPGRTDNDIKNYWNTKLKKKLMGFLPTSHHHRKSPLFEQSSPPNPPFPCSQTVSSMYREFSSYCNVGSANISFPGLEPISAAPSSYTSFQNPESLVSLSPMQYCPVKDSILMFGSEGSCSSSDGSCGQISHGREMKQEAVGLQNYTFEEYANKIMLSHGSNNENNINQWAEVQTTGFISETPLDYVLEDIKQLISSSSSCNNININNNYGYEGLFNIDENKTQQQEKAMYYYY